MFFDLEPYLPFNVFVVICIIAICGIATWGADRDNRNNGEK